MKLVIGNKNYSSWSLRPWLLAKQAGIPFGGVRVRLLSETFAVDVARHSPAGRVPVLVDGDMNVWGSLAICETLAERSPRTQLWPVDPKARAHARPICAEMHSGFTNLRNNMPMNVTAVLPGMGWNVAVQRDIDRIAAVRTELRQEYATKDPFLFGHFTAANAFYAPVVSRFVTYNVRLPEAAKIYTDYILNLSVMQEWISDMRAEHGFLADGKPYCTVPNEDTLVAAGQ